MLKMGVGGEPITLSGKFPKIEKDVRAREIREAWWIRRLKPTVNGRSELTRAVEFIGTG